MSILIKGIDMPKDCWECQMFGTWEVGKFSCFFGAKVKDIDIRAIDCPLIEIPTPHGRLIDANALDQALRRKWNYGDNGVTIANAPTILEEEE